MLLDSPIIPKYSRKLPRLQVASLESRWYLHFLLISGGFGAFIIYSRLGLAVFFYCLRQLPSAKYSYAESQSPFRHFCRYAIVQDSSPDVVLTGNESRAVICCQLFSMNNRRRPIASHKWLKHQWLFEAVSVKESSSRVWTFWFCVNLFL